MNSDDWKHAEHEILSRLDIRAELAARGVVFTGDPNDDGWCACRALREGDDSPSAAVCVKSSNGALGRYTDKGGEHDSFSFWDLLVRLGAFTDWQAARAHYAERTGVELPGKKKHGLLDSLDFSIEPALHDQMISRWCEVKPPVTPAAVKAAGGRVCRWPKHAPPDAQLPCIAFFAFRSGKLCGVLLYRVDGQPFAAFGKLGERKTHNIKGSKDGWLVVGDQTALDTATTIWRVEGPGDALALYPHLPAGHVVVTNICGAGGTVKLPVDGFRGKPVNVVGDQDTSGQKGAHAFAAKVASVDSEVRIAKLPYELATDHGKDLRDFFCDGHTFAELVESLGEPIEKASAPPNDKASAVPEGMTPEEYALVAPDPLVDDVTIRNGKHVGTGDDREFIALAMRHIVSRIFRRTGNWPRRVGTALFVNPGPRVIQWLEKPSSLFGYLGTRAGEPSEFYKVPGSHTQGEVFEELRRTAEAYAAIELLPHEPPYPDFYYACQSIPPGDGSTMTEFLNRFSPATDLDRDLMFGMAATLIWGGPPGARPAMLFDSDDGRGAGKSKTAAMFAELAGGIIDIGQNETIEIIKQRLLSADGLTRRFVLLDNVKSLRFSWGELESLITNPVISGKRLYVGEFQRPNVLLWCITLNGASLSTDLAQRCVIIKVRRPVFSGTWEEETRAFIDANREKIIGDLFGFFRDVPPRPLARYTRWGAWEKDVLSRLPEPAATQALILERQGAADVEIEEADLLGEFIERQLVALDYFTGSQRIFIPSAVLARWVNWATNEQHTVTAASRIIYQKIREGKLPRLHEPTSKTYGRGVVWIGASWDGVSTLLDDVESRIAFRMRNDTEKS